MSKRNFSGCSYLNNWSSGTSYLTNQALRRMRYLHTPIATQKWRSVQDKKNLNIKKCLADMNPRAQAFAISLGPVAVSKTPTKCEPCVYSARVTTSRDSSRWSNSRDSSRVRTLQESRAHGISRCNRCHTRSGRDRNRYNQVHCVNIGNDDSHERFTVITHDAFIPRSRTLMSKPNQRRCLWTENLDLPLDELRLVHDETGDGKSSDVSKTLPSIVLTKSDETQGHTNARQTLDVKPVRLKTPPPSPVRHINIHLPGS